MVSRFRPPRHQWDRNLLLGVLCICLSGFTSPLMNGFAKLLGESYSSLPQAPSSGSLRPKERERAGKLQTV
jgi:hypothetical protein